MTSTVAADPIFTSATRDEEFPVLREYTYLNAAFSGPIATRAAQALAARAEALQNPGITRGTAEPDHEALVRERIAGMIGARPEEIVFTFNTSQGINACAQGIAFRPGDNVVIPADEFPSLTYTWLNLRAKGVEVRIVPFSGVGPTASELLARVDDRTRAVSCSAITWNTGWRAELEALGAGCAARGVLLVVDGIQAVGAEEIDVKALRVSALAFHGYKWLLGGFGLGVLYVAPDAVDRIAPTFISAAAVHPSDAPTDDEPRWREGVARYSLSNNNRAAYVTLLAALDLHTGLGMRAIAERNRALVAQLRDGLATRRDLRVVSAADPARRSAITVFTTGDRARDAALAAQLEEQRIMVSLRPLGVRVSPHFYNTDGDIARLLDALPH
jgi:cysteine desulfurase/selenocysteine lyase